MQPTLLANSWVAAHLPNTTHMAVLCCAGSAGEAAFRNSLDNQFVEVGYQHQSNWKLPRRPTFLVVGTALENGVLATKRRITRSGHIISDPPLFQHATVFCNSTAMGICLDALTLDLGSMQTVRSFPGCFTKNCTTLRSIVQLPPNLETMGGFLFRGCTNLAEIDMGSLEKLRALPNFFMQGCTGLRSIKFPPNLTVVGDCFLQGTSLTDIDMSSLVGVTKLPERFMYSCKSLLTVQFPPKLEELGKDAFQGCTSLTEIDMSSLEMLRKLPYGFLFGCTSLMSVKLPPPSRGAGEAHSKWLHLPDQA